LLTIKYFDEDIPMRTKAARGLVSTTVVIVTLVLMDGIAYAQTDKEDVEKRLAIIKEQCKKGFFSQKDCKDAKKQVLEQLVSGGQVSQPPAKPTESHTERQGEPAFVGTRSVLPIIASVQTPSIEGTYQFVSRTLPDGTVLKPPDIIGLLTYSKNRRTIIYAQKDATGKIGLVTSVAGYTLTDTEYRGSISYNMQDGGKDNGFSRVFSYAFSGSGKTDRTPVNMEGGRIQIKDTFRSFSQVFEGTKMTATDDGITEVWEKVQ